MDQEIPGALPTHKPKLLETVRAVLRRKHYSLRTEVTYVDWIKRFILFHHKQRPRQLDGEAVNAFLTHLAVERHVAASTQNQALSALLFLYQQVLRIDLPRSAAVAPARRARRLPAVFTPAEAHSGLAHLKGDYLLMAQLLYGSGLRLMECLRLRIKDLDLTRLQLTVRAGKGNKDPLTLLPVRVAPALRLHLEGVRCRHEQALVRGDGGTFLPHAYERKSPAAAAAWPWQYVFPAERASARSAQRRVASPPPRREEPAKCGQGGHPESRDRQGGQLPHVSSFFRHAPAGKWL